MSQPPPSSTLFPYTTLFRSGFEDVQAHNVARLVVKDQVKIIELHDAVQTCGKIMEQILQIAMRGNGLRHFQKHLIGDRKSTRLNSSHMSISYAVFCLKKKIK